MSGDTPDVFLGCVVLDAGTDSGHSPIPDEQEILMTATFINIISVDPAKQQEVVDILSQGTDDLIRHRPGFVSVTLLASADGSKVINIAEWESPDAAKATLGDPAAQEFAKKVAALGTPDPGVYKKVADFTADQA
ncbi:antibiotic biosynthesis monooxygenase family protein [Nocardia sp. CA-290969]|uniref:antibiotic biosynthesis monooxygenase family protein n=1 Tax=Nocardia sp. CA-290969 TaxID=3239986 RepID=UPI003D91513F